MYIVIYKQLPRGSWKVAEPKIFDDKEKAEDWVAAMDPLTKNFGGKDMAKFKVIFIGDSFDWNL